MSKGFASNYRVGLLASLILAGYGAAGARLVWLHVIDRDNLLASVGSARREIIPIYARRGDIRDINGTLLATSVSDVEVGVDLTMVGPEDLPKWPELARLLQLPLAQVEKAITTRYRTTAQSRAGGSADLVSNFNIKIPGVTSPPAADAAAGSAADNEEEPDEPDSSGQRPIE